MAGGFADVLKGYFRRRTAIYLSVVIVFAMGTVWGGLAVGRVGTDQRAALGLELEGLMDVEKERAFPEPEDVLRQAAADQLLKTVGLIGLLGLSIIGAPFVLAVVFLRGFVLGFTAAFLVDRLMFRGLILAVAAIVPHNVLAVPALIVAGASAISFSLAAVRVLLGRRETSMYHHLLGTGLLLGTSAAAFVAAAFVEAYVTPVLMDAVARMLP
ncbi:MAG: stage II sporulation protein M [Firmicutes bacterium]|nr:stage II sporulation protein M [Bacillota bacterium]